MKEILRETLEEEGVKSPIIPRGETMRKELEMYDVRVYDAKTEAEKRLSDHFRVKEFACSDKSRPVFISQTLIDFLEAIRRHFGRPVNIHSGYRTAAYNASLPGSSSNSKHCMGLAADFDVTGVTPKEVYSYAESLLGSHGGLGLYSWGVHLDVRAEKSRWTG